MKNEKIATSNGLGALLRKSRKELKLSVRFVANRCDVPFGYLASVERGEVERPKIKMLETLCDMYGLDKDSIIFMAGKIPQDVYWKIVNNPSLVKTIRNLEV